MRTSDLAVILGIITAMKVIGVTKYGIECVITGAVVGIYFGLRLNHRKKHEKKY